MKVDMLYNLWPIDIIVLIIVSLWFKQKKIPAISRDLRLLTNPVRRHRVCQIIQRLNIKQKGMRGICSTFAFAKCVNCLRQFRSAFRTNRGISPSSEVDLGLCPYLAPPSSKPRELPQKVDQNFYAFCQHKTFVSGLRLCASFLLTLQRENIPLRTFL